MKKQLKKVIKMMLPNFMVEYHERRKSKKINYYDSEDFIGYVYRKKHGLMRHADTIETLAIRGSNTDYGFYSPLIKNSYNLGLISSDLYFNYHLYHQIKKGLPKLKNVVYFYNVPANGMSLIRLKERYRLVIYKYFFNIDYQERGFIDQKQERRIFKKCSKYSQNIEKSYYGYERKTKYIVTPPDLRAQQLLRENTREPDQIEWLRKLIIEIASDNINLVVVLPPHLTAFQRNLPSADIVFKKLYDLLDEYPSVLLIDLYNSKLFTDDDMGDADHLNERGAIKITSEVQKVMSEKGYL